MDRIELLRATYDILLSWKDNLGKFMLVQLIEYFIFPEQKYICPTLTATKFLHCHIKYYSPERTTVSTSHMSDPAQRQFCVSKAILHF